MFQEKFRLCWLQHAFPPSGQVWTLAPSSPTPWLQNRLQLGAGECWRSYPCNVLMVTIWLAWEWLLQACCCSAQIQLRWRQVGGKAWHFAVNLYFTIVSLFHQLDFGGQGTPWDLCLSTLGTTLIWPRITRLAPTVGRFKFLVCTRNFNNVLSTTQFQVRASHVTESWRVSTWPLDSVHCS